MTVPGFNFNLKISAIRKRISKGAADGPSRLKVQIINPDIIYVIPSRFKANGGFQAAVIQIKISYAVIYQ